VIVPLPSIRLPVQLASEVRVGMWVGSFVVYVGRPRHHRQGRPLQ
jgi:hypothetical protein